jgi:hypothetical protein
VSEIEIDFETVQENNVIQNFETSSNIDKQPKSLTTKTFMAVFSFGGLVPLNCQPPDIVRLNCSTQNAQPQISKQVRNH